MSRQHVTGSEKNDVLLGTSRRDVLSQMNASITITITPTAVLTPGWTSPMWAYVMLSRRCQRAAHQRLGDVSSLRDVLAVFLVGHADPLLRHHLPGTVLKHDSRDDLVLGLLSQASGLSTAPLRQARSSLTKRRRKPARCAYQNTSME